jgi:hypothetical protein
MRCERLQVGSWTVRPESCLPVAGLPRSNRSAPPAKLAINSGRRSCVQPPGAPASDDATSHRKAVAHCGQGSICESFGIHATEPLQRGPRLTISNSQLRPRLEQSWDKQRNAAKPSPRRRIIIKTQKMPDRPPDSFISGISRYRQISRGNRKPAP